MTAPEIPNPTDTSPLTIERERSSAEAGTFTVLSGARLRCETCGTVSDAAEQSADDAARTEGASDPADMTLVVHLVCPNCGTAGVLTLGYGPEADPDAADVIAAMPRNPRGPMSMAGRPGGPDRAPAAQGEAGRDPVADTKADAATDPEGDGGEEGGPDNGGPSSDEDEGSPGSDLARAEPPAEPNEPA